MVPFAAICLATAGCNQEAARQMVADTKAFESASPVIKDDWAKTLAAVSSRDYSTAIISCRKLQALTELTPEQRVAVNKTLAAVSQQMTAAAAKGDPDAIKAIQEMRKQGRGR